MKYNISLQNNSSPRDYVYEMSVMFITARSLQLITKLEIPSKIINSNNNSLCDILTQYPDYSEKALMVLITLLNSLAILTVSNDKVQPSDFLVELNNHSAQFAIDNNIWNSHFDIMSLLSNNDNMKKYANQDIHISLINNSLTYSANSSVDIISELVFSHIISRAICFAVTHNFFDILAKLNNTCSVLDFLTCLENSHPNTSWNTNNNAIRNLLFLLARYHLIKFDVHTDMLEATPFSACLTKSSPDSIASSMYLIDMHWWGAASILEEGLKKNNQSPFQIFNSMSFNEMYYGAHNKLSKRFSKAMASISLYEDHDVGNIIKDFIPHCSTVIDIGGGEGGLLSILYEHYPSKHYILFEKSTGEPEKDIAEKALLSVKIARKYPQLNIEIILGDFNKPFNETNLPKVKNAVYLVKCVLHNMQSIEIITKTLKNISKVLDEGSELFLAERIIPQPCLRPHRNIFGAILMLMLFKADTYTMRDYKIALDNAGLNIQNTIAGGNYLVFRTSKKPRLEVQLHDNISPKPVLSSSDPSFISINECSEENEHNKFIFK